MNEEYSGTIRVGDVIVPTTKVDMDIKYDPSEWPTIAPPFSFSAEIIGQLFGRHEVHEVEPGVYNHTFTPAYWPFRMASETASLRDGPCIPATYHVISQRAVRLALKAKAEERKQKRRRKIVRKQKRAALRRKKRGLA